MPGARVVLHDIGPERQGPADSMRTDSEGRFRFTFRADTTHIHLVSARYAGIEYFSTAIAPASRDTAIPLLLLVADTSSTAPVDLTQRHLVISAPDAHGIRNVVDMLVLANAGTLTRVAPDSTPVWRLPLPEEAGQVQITPASDFSPDAVVARNGGVEIRAPIAPGARQLLVQYDLVRRPGEVAVPFPSAVPTVNLLLEEAGVTLAGLPLVRADSQEIEGRLLRRWTGQAPAGAVLLLQFHDGIAPGTRLALLVGVIALLFLGAGAVVLRHYRRVPAGAIATPAPADDLLHRIAMLDVEHAAGEAAVGAERWRVYQDERARLKARLAAELARARPPA